ncbi:dipeptide epimerase [Sulfurimonas sp. SAG-AH-194-L11]|nr:dipeptide epimerase [Sulfurimonas sp. SAG-AH-194-L11]MDF1876815.1 dipeptide epimerase [Sulfurimonas sp. SAG-AH-194-L11]
MIIKSIRTQIKYIALKTPFITALRRVETIEFVRVSVMCEGGEVGIGEAPATMAITGEDIQIIMDSIARVKDVLIGLEIQNALELLHQQSIGSSAKAALDIAFMSLLGFFRLKNTQSIQTDITISLNDVATMLRDAKDACENGMSILKIKLGSDMNHAIEVTQKLSKTFIEAKLLIDANQAWSLAESLTYVNAVEHLNIELIEQPVVAEDLASLKLITDATTIPILADEATFTLGDVKAVMKNKSADMINIKLMKCGGVSRAVEILEYARENKIKCMLGSMLEGPYSINAALYLAFNYSDVIEYVDLDSPLLYKERSTELDFIYSDSFISPS